MNGSGVYCIRNTVNGKVYVGSTKCFSKRWIEHQSDLRNISHHSTSMQLDWVRSGIGAFEFVVLLECDCVSLLEREREFVESMKATDPKRGYNTIRATAVQIAESSDTLSPSAISGVRKSLGETQVEFARRFCRTVRSVENWEQGVCHPDPLVVRELERLSRKARGL